MNGFRLFPPHALDEHVHPEAYAYYFRQWRAFDMAFHRHDSTEIMYVIRGSCRVEAACGGKSSGVSSVELSSGDFIIVGANVPHRLIVDGSCRMLNVEFGLARGRFRTPSLRDLAGEEPALAELLSSPEPFTVLHDPDEVYHALKSLVLELDGCAERAASGSGTYVQLLFAQLLMRIARLAPKSAADASSSAERYVRRCIDFMRQHYDRDLRARDIAAAVNLHPAYVHRLFKAQTGKTLNDYLTELRMEKAKMLLSRTDIPIADISEYVGVGSRQYFHALFKRHAGQTPAQFRQSAVARGMVHEKAYALRWNPDDASLAPETAAESIP